MTMIIRSLSSAYRNMILTMPNIDQSTCSTASSTGIYHSTISILHHTEHSEPEKCVEHHPFTLSPTNIWHAMHFITSCGPCTHHTIHFCLFVCTMSSLWLAVRIFCHCSSHYLLLLFLSRCGCAVSTMNNWLAVCL